MRLYSQKKDKQPANKTERVVHWKQDDAQRISDVVRIVEGARRERNPSTLPRAFSGGGLVDAFFYGAWNKGTIKMITLASDTTSTSTSSAINLLKSIQPHSSQESVPRLCIVARISTAAEFTLVNAEC